MTEHFEELVSIVLPKGKKIYFLSDFHLGAPDHASSLEREKKVVAFLDKVKADASTIFLVGDMFDFWFEYATVVPKGYVRLLGKLAELTDVGIDLHFFVGNHDMWMAGYFETELSIPVYHAPKCFLIQDRSFFIGHGDGLGPGDEGYKRLKKIFRSPLCKWLFGTLHPSVGMGIANYMSRRSKEKTGLSDEIFLGEDKEWLVRFCKDTLEKQHYDFFVFGHRHLPLDLLVGPISRYINLGDWIRTFTYASFDGSEMRLEAWKG